MATPTSTLWELSDRKADGKLERTIRKMRDAETSVEQIGRQLYADHEIRVSRPTLENWIRKLYSVEAK